MFCTILYALGADIDNEVIEHEVAPAVGIKGLEKTT